MLHAAFSFVSSAQAARLVLSYHLIFLKGVDEVTHLGTPRSQCTCSGRWEGGDGADLWPTPLSYRTPFLSFFRQLSAQQLLICSKSTPRGTGGSKRLPPEVSHSLDTTHAPLPQPWHLQMPLTRPAWGISEMRRRATQVAIGWRATDSEKNGCIEGSLFFHKMCGMGILGKISPAPALKVESVAEESWAPGKLPAQWNPNASRDSPQNYWIPEFLRITKPKQILSKIY